MVSKHVSNHLNNVVINYKSARGTTLDLDEKRSYEKKRVKNLEILKKTLQFTVILTWWFTFEKKMDPLYS